jgi:CopG family nickel-responsive transcriptional regulator
MKSLSRFGVSIETDLLNEFDKLLERSGYGNRSEAFRDLIRARLVEERVQNAHASVLGVLTLVYDHHQRELEKRLNDIQHHAHHSIISTTHVHVDHDSCLEVILLRGKAGHLRELSTTLGRLKGVKHTSLALTTVERI